MGSMHPVQVIAVTGGKGGVGKTNVSVNLSLALRNTIGRKFVVETTSVSPSQRARELPIHRRIASATRGRASSGMTRWSCTISLRMTS